MAELFTVKQIAEIMTKEFAGGAVESKFTEERVRARLRSARAQGIIKAQHLGYDRRTNYYTAEDIEKLKAEWIGPERAEFTDYPEDLDIINPDEEEITIRKATLKDADAIIALLPAGQPQQEKEALRPYIIRMLKSSQYASYVAVMNEEVVIGCAQAEISPPASLIRRAVTGAIYIYVESTRKDARIIVRSLYHRARQWLAKFNVRSEAIELPADLTDLADEFARTMFTVPETRVLMLASKFSFQ
jgi:hypothetical protein